ncbi:unnamed protein product, partial [Mesorhabditis spiculigera]
MWFYLVFALLGGVQAVEPIIACYYNLSPPANEVDPTLCTHYLLISYTTITGNGMFDPPSVEEARNFSIIKERNPKAKLMLCVTASNPHWSMMVSTPLKMQNFADASAQYMKQHGFDGIDLDWEFPTWSSDAKKSDRNLLTILLKTLRFTYGDRFLLTMATSGPPTITRKAYDVSSFNKYCDFINVMNYDFHVFSWTNPVVGFNAPLKPMSREYSIIGEMNSMSSLASYSTLGLWSNKTVFGIPVYNLGFRLVNYYWNWPYAPAEGEVNTFTSYPSTCNITKETHANGIVYREYWNNAAASPYIVGNDKVWLTTENPRSTAAKAQFAKDSDCAGIMLFQISTDDNRGICGEGKNPLIKAAKKAFLGK